MKEQSYAPAQAKQSEAALESHAPPAAMRSSIVVGVSYFNIDPLALGLALK